MNEGFFDDEISVDLEKRMDESIEETKKELGKKPFVFRHLLKNGEEVLLETELSKEKVKLLPPFPNQHQFYKYFKVHNLAITVRGVVKPPLVKEAENEPE